MYAFDCAYTCVINMTRSACECARKQMCVSIYTSVCLCMWICMRMGLSICLSVYAHALMGVYVYVRARNIE